MGALKDHYQLRVTDVRPLSEIAAGKPQSARAPLPEALDPPHENRVVDVTKYDEVLAACRGMDAAINLTVVRPTLKPAFAVNTVGAYNIAKAAVATGLKRLIHTGPFHLGLGWDADYAHEFDLGDDIPLRPGTDLYAMTKFLGGQVIQTFAERHGLEVITFLYCGFRPRAVQEDEKGKGLGPFYTTWEDTGEAFLYGLRAPDMPRPYEPFFITSRLPHGMFRIDKAKRLLGWEPDDRLQELYRISS
jgi:hypothetical protein